MAGKVALYSAVDSILTHYQVDVEAATLLRKATIKVPAKVQYAWPHPSRNILYLTTSSAGPRVRSDDNHVSALVIGAEGELRPHGAPRELPRRAVHLCVDLLGQHVLNAHNFEGGGLTVHRLEEDGTIGDEIAQDAALDFGTYPHQVRFLPSGRTVMIVDRGINAQGEAPEAPGALRTYPFTGGRLSAGQVVAPSGGVGFGPRHVAFHPSMPWIYASDERFNKLYMVRCPADRLDAAPAYTRDTLADPANLSPRQLGGPIHVHPAGHCVYLANRADHTIDGEGGKVFGGGENTIVVYAIDPASGEPTLVQHMPTRSFHVRTFSCDPTGRLLIAGSVRPVAVGGEAGMQVVGATLSLFRVDGTGLLEFVRSYEVETEAGQMQYWTGMVGLH